MIHSHFGTGYYPIYLLTVRTWNIMEHQCSQCVPSRMSHCGANQRFRVIWITGTGKSTTKKVEVKHENQREANCQNDHLAVSD